MAQYELTDAERDAIIVDLQHVLGCVTLSQEDIDLRNGILADITPPDPADYATCRHRIPMGQPCEDCAGGIASEI